MRYTYSTNRGFSLIELLVVMTMIAITVTIAVPAFQTSAAKQQIDSPKKALRNTLSAARTEAVSRSIPAIVCASDDQASCGGTWSDGWIAFLDNVADGAYDADDDELLVAHPAISASVTLSYSEGSSLAFTNQGFLSTTAGDFVFCYNDEADPSVPQYARALLVGGSGVVRSSVDSDDSGVYEDTDGDIVCP